MTRNGLNNTFSRQCTPESHARFVNLCIATDVSIPVSAREWSTLRMMQETANLHRRIDKENR